MKIVLSGTDETISRIVSEYSNMLLKLAASRLESAADAEDAVQEVFLKLLSSGITFRDAEHEKAWLIRATLNRASDIRRSARQKNLPLDETLCVSSGGEAYEILSAVRSLPQKYSAVIHLHYYEGYTIKEISSLLGLPAATVGTRLSRGRAALQKILKEEL